VPERLPDTDALTLSDVPLAASELLVDGERETVAE